MIFHTNLLKVILMKFKNISGMSYLFGFAIIINMCSTMVLLSNVFGDSTTPKSNAISPLLTQPSKVIK
jgi:hypothetical protein